MVRLPDRCAHTPLLRRWHPRHRDPNQSATHATHPPQWDPARGDVPQTGSESTGACGEFVPQTGSESTGACGGQEGSSRIPCPSACPTRARVRSGIQTCTVRSQMSQSDVPIQNSQYVALFDDFCILVAPESDFPVWLPCLHAAWCTLHRRRRAGARGACVRAAPSLLGW